MMIAVVGATRNTGRAVVKELRKRWSEASVRGTERNFADDTNCSKLEFIADIAGGSFLAWKFLRSLCSTQSDGQRTTRT